MEYVPRESMPQLSRFSLLHWEVEIRFFAASGKYITLSKSTICLILLESIIENLIDPMPAAVEHPDTPLTPIRLEGSDMVVNNSDWEQMCCVAQLSAPNSVGVGMNENCCCELLSELLLANAKTSVVRQRVVLIWCLCDVTDCSGEVVMGLRLIVRAEVITEEWLLAKGNHGAASVMRVRCAVVGIMKLDNIATDLTILASTEQGFVAYFVVARCALI